MMKHLLIVFLSIPVFTNAHVDTTFKGIKFEEGLSWQEVLSKAKQENKYIFVDCYTTWCGPCKYMSKNVFPQKEVGDFFNENFISIAVQIDRTPNDPEEVRNRYADAKAIETRYSIGVFPTYLFFSPDGREVHRVTGATGKDGKEFISKGEDALNKDKQYYTIINSYKAHLGDSVFLRNALIRASEVGDKLNTSEIGAYYMSCIRDSFRKDNIELIYRATASTKDKGFQFFLDNKTSIDSIMTNEWFTIVKLREIIIDEELKPLFEEPNVVLDWKKISENLTNKYPSIAKDLIPYAKGNFAGLIQREIEQPIYRTDAPPANWQFISRKLARRFPGFNVDIIIAKAKPKYYAYKKDWLACEKAAFDCFNQFGKVLTEREINNLAWDYVFMHATDNKIILEAVKWVKSTITDYPAIKNIGTINNMDTYANLLYKAGQVDSAISWERKAIEKLESLNKEDVNQRDLMEFKVTLGKMQRREKTWPEY